MTPLTREDMERRRMAAAILFSDGVRPWSVSKQLGVSRMSAYRWYWKWVAGASLARRRGPGRPHRVSVEIIERQIRDICMTAPSGRKRWTHETLAAELERQHDVKYNPDHLGRILRTLGICLRHLPKLQAGSHTEAA